MNQRRCNYLVVTSLPLRWCASAVAAATAASVAVAAATVQQRQRGTGARQCRRRGQGREGGGDTVLRSCLQHCKAAPQPRETGQKKRKCRSGSDGARDGTRGASEIPSSGWEGTAQSAKGGEVRGARRERRRRKCVFGHVTLPLLRLAEAECVNHRPRPPFSPVALHN